MRAGVMPYYSKTAQERKQIWDCEQEKDERKLDKFRKQIESVKYEGVIGAVKLWKDEKK